MQFEIAIFVNVPRITGVAALDWRRAHGLPDHNYVYPTRLRVTEYVDEGFARAHFDATNNSESETVPAAWLVPGELAPIADRTGEVEAGNFAPGRIRDLWLAARYRREAAAKD